MKKVAPEVDSENDSVLVTWENNDGITEARVFETDDTADEEVTEFVAALLSEDEDGEYSDNDIENGVGDTDTILVFVGHVVGSPKLQSSVTYE